MQEAIGKAHSFQEPSNLYEAAQMAQLYMNHMLTKAHKIQEEELNLHEELGHLQLAIEDERQKAKKVEVKLHSEVAKSYKINQQLDIANGKIMGY